MVDLTPGGAGGGSDDDGHRGGDGDRCLVIHPYVKARNADDDARAPEARLDEICGLAEAIHLEVTAREIVQLSQIKPNAFFGKGTLERLDTIIKANDLGLVIVDAHLSPVQQRNMELAWKCKVLDRTGIILEIFGERAATKEGRLQVDLAHLTYQRSRLVRSWTHLERQRGGAGFMGGPGERQIEIDRRLIDQRIDKLKRQLKDVKRTRDLHRAARRKVPYPIVALVGYTNAGKSTLFNRLTRAEVMAKDQLFATLDPTMRALDLPSGKTVILSDTVGFISDLPHELVEAFHATLEEVQEAHVVVHVRDISHPDTDAQAADVMGVLKDLGLDDEDLLNTLVEVRNKSDLLSTDHLDTQRNLAARSSLPVVLMSAETGTGVDEFLQAVDDRLAEGMETLHLTIDAQDGKTIAWLYAHGDVIEREDDGHDIHLAVRLDQADAQRFAHRSRS